MADEWHKVDIPYVTKLVGFRALSRSGEDLPLSAHPHDAVFVRTADDDLWSADAFVGFYLKKTKTTIQDYAPPTLAVNATETVEFPITVSPPGTFHVVTDEGKIDVGEVIVNVEFRRRQH